MVSTTVHLSIKLSRVPRPCGMINLSNIISYGRSTLPNLIDKKSSTFKIIGQPKAVLFFAFTEIRHIVFVKI